MMTFELLRKAYAWLVGLITGVWGWAADINWLAALGALAALAALADKLHAMYQRRKLTNAQLEKLTNR